MKIQCPNCDTVYDVEDSKIPDNGTFATCAQCQFRFFIKKPSKHYEESTQQEKIHQYNVSLKKCPFCGEYIQKEAIKCRYCGEWLKEKPSFEKSLIIESSKGNSAKKDRDTENVNTENKNTSDDRVPCPDNNCTGIINPNGICSECGRTPEEVRRGVESKATTFESEVTYMPLKQKSRWGWGWWLLLGAYGTGMQKLSFYVTRTTIIISIVGAILLLPFYFWLRNKMIRKREYSESIWRSSLMAGVISYFLFTILIAGSLGFIGKIQENSNIKTEIEALTKEYKAKLIRLRQEEIKIDDSLISTPTSDADIKHNTRKLNEYLVLLNKKNNLLKNFFGYLNEQIERENDEKSKKIFNQLKRLLDKHFNLSRKSIETLINYYETGDDKLWNVYEKMLKEIEPVEKELQEMIITLIGRERMESIISAAEKGSNF